MVALFAQQPNIIDFPPTAIGQGKSSSEWYTPATVIRAARSVMGTIDLDPASCTIANQTVRASRYFTKQDDGLAQEWYANVWLNPPFARDNTLPNGQKSGLVQWISKLIDHYESGQVKQAILLATTKTDTNWFHLLWNYPICFADHSVRFNRTFKGNNKHPGYTIGHIHGTCFVYLGPNNEKFAEVFSEFGPVIPANVAIRRQRVTPLSLWEDEA